ncbi:hypothetical protein TYRP_004944 [Tyrophagus putrescentiae]|nr:hypothetical protein TYRP_004944 [Tyrophagus putrescentiae]
MPPRRPIPDLCIIAVLKQLTPIDQMKASRMSPRCSRLVRAANRLIRSLVLTDYDYGLDCTQHNLNRNFFPSSLSMQLWAEDAERNGGNKVDYQPRAAPVSKWNSLQFSNIHQDALPTVEEVVTVLFSAVTNLSFVGCYMNYPCSIEYLTALLQHPHWASQLTSLTLNDSRKLSDELVHPLFSAINSLTALKHLVLNMEIYEEIPDLPILAQLKSSICRPCWPHFESHAVGNDNLQVHLNVFAYDDENALIALKNHPLRSRIVCLKGLSFKNFVPFQHGQQFPSLTSLQLGGYPGWSPPEVKTLFTALSQLPQLVHFLLSVDLSDLDDSSPRLLTQLSSVRALDLNLYIKSHSQIHAGIPANRIVLNNRKPYPTAEDVFANSQ